MCVLKYEGKLREGEYPVGGQGGYLTTRRFYSKKETRDAVSGRFLTANLDHFGTFSQR